MNKVFFFFLLLVLFFQSTVFAQAEEKYAERIEKLLDFENTTLKDTINIYEVIKGTNDELDKRIRKAQKLKQNTDSITTKTIDLLKEMKTLANDSVLRKMNDLFVELIESDKDSITNIDQFISGVDLLKQIDKVMEDFNEKGTYLSEESEEILNAINVFRAKNDLDVIPKEKDPLETFAEQYLVHYFNDSAEFRYKFLAKEKEIAFRFEKEAPKLYFKQLHRFEFIKGILHYNEKTLLRGQKISDIEGVLGSDYVKIVEEDEDHYGVIRYKNIPLKIGFENEVVVYFDILFTSSTSDESDYSFLNEGFIKLEDYYFNKKFSSLQSLVPKIREDTQRAFFIGNSSSDEFGNKFICYDNPNDSAYDEKIEIDRHFYLYLNDNESEIRTIYYEEN